MPAVLVPTRVTSRISFTAPLSLCGMTGRGDTPVFREEKRILEIRYWIVTLAM